MNEAQLIWKVLAETGHLPYFGGAGIGLLEALSKAFGPWRAVSSVDGPASPVLAWLREHADAAELYWFPKPSSLEPAAAPPADREAGAVPVLLGAQERDLLDAGAVAFGFATQPRRYRLRTLDALLDGEDRLGLLHIGSFREAPAILEGARRVLRRSGPAVLLVRDAERLEPKSLADLEAVSKVLAGVGYSLYDSGCNPCGTQPALRAALEDWQETVFFGVPARHADRTLDLLGGGTSGAGTSRVRAYWNHLTRYQPQATAKGLRLAADQMADCSGFYPTESWENLRWRWSGPAPRALVRLPLQRPGRYQLRCRLLKVADERVLDSLRLFVNGAVVEHRAKRADHETILEADLTFSLAGFAPVAELLFVHAATFKANAEDPRRLGLALLDISLEREAP